MDGRAREVRATSAACERDRQGASVVRLERTIDLDEHARERIVSRDRTVTGQRVEHRERGFDRRRSFACIDRDARIDQPVEPSVEPSHAGRHERAAERVELRLRARRRAEEELGGEEAVRAAACRRAQGRHEAEVEQADRTVLVDEHVRRLEVAVHETAVVEREQRAQELDRESVCFARRRRHEVERSADHVLEHDRERSVFVRRDRVNGTRGGVSFEIDREPHLALERVARRALLRALHDDVGAAEPIARAPYVGPEHGVHRIAVDPGAVGHVAVRQ